MQGMSVPVVHARVVARGTSLDHFSSASDKSKFAKKRKRTQTQAQNATLGASGGGGGVGGGEGTETKPNVFDFLNRTFSKPSRRAHVHPSSSSSLSSSLSSSSLSSSSERVITNSSLPLHLAMNLGSSKEQQARQAEARHHILDLQERKKAQQQEIHKLEDAIRRHAREPKTQKLFQAQLDSAKQRLRQMEMSESTLSSSLQKSRKNANYLKF
jgi:hypothetical protein